MKKFFAFAGALMALALISPAFAQAAAPAAVSIPWGDWLASVLTWGEKLVVLAAGAAVARWAPTFVRSILTEQMLSQAVDYAFAAVAGAVRGKMADVKTTNALISVAIGFVEQNAPAIAAKYGASLEANIIARLSAAGAVPAEASSANLGAAKAA